MNIWEVNTENNIKVISDTNIFTVQYMKYGDEKFIDLPSPIDLGDMLYLIKYTFTEIGDYLIKLKDDSGLTRYVDIKVLDNIEFMKVNTQYSVMYDGPSLVFEESK